MKVSMLFYESTAAIDEQGTEKAQARMRAWDAYIGELVTSGAMAGGEALLGPATAKTVRIKAGAHHVQDGPYADTKEQLGGFVTLTVADLDEALAWAKKCPAAEYGVVEVRPVWEERPG